MPEGLWPVALVISMVVSLFVAQAAHRGVGGWAWGLLGPVGWIIAAIHGAADQIAPRREEQPANPDYAPRTGRDTVRSVRGPADAEGRVLVTCGDCNETQRLSPEPESVAICLRCDGKLPGFARKRTG